MPSDRLSSIGRNRRNIRRFILFRLCCLLENAAKCANTASVYGAFFKHLKQSAQKTLVIAPADYQINNGEHEVYNEDANSLIKRIEGDILYLDPPYNSQQYSANYHLLNTIADYKSFTPKGKTELREYNKSNYCSKGESTAYIQRFDPDARFRYIVLSYNNEGIMPMQTIEQIMTKYGNYQMFQKEHQRFKADKTENKNHLADTTTEYLTGETESAIVARLIKCDATKYGKIQYLSGNRKTNRIRTANRQS